MLTTKELAEWTTLVANTRAQTENKLQYIELTGKIELLQWISSEIQARLAAANAEAAAREEQEGPSGGDLPEDSAESPPAAESDPN